MKLRFGVTTRDSNGNTTRIDEVMGLPALIKHMAFAGMGKATSFQKGMSYISNVCGYWGRFYCVRTLRTHFDHLPISHEDSDSTREFSRVVGRALVDYLMKKHDGAQFTLNYESVMAIMGMSISGRRGDLIGFSRTGEIVVVSEAKGRSGSVSDNEMSRLKFRTSHWPIKSSVTRVGVVQRIFSGVEVKYYDPRMNATEVTEDEFRKIKETFYSGVKDFLEKFQNYVVPISINRDSIAIPMSVVLSDETGKKSIRELAMVRRLDPYIVISNSILRDLSPPEEVVKPSSERFYLDSDGIGISLGKPMSL